MGKRRQHRSKKTKPAPIPLQYAQSMPPSVMPLLGRKGIAKALAVGVATAGLTETGVRTTQKAVNHQTQKSQNRFRQAASNAWIGMQYGAISIPQAQRALNPLAQDATRWRRHQQIANKLGSKPIKAAYAGAALGAGTKLGSWLIRKKRKK